MNERLLHVCLRTDFEKQPALAAALRSISQRYGEVDWIKHKDKKVRVQKLIEQAKVLRPTLVFMQLQCGGVFEPEDLARLRALCDPTCVIVAWDGDIREDPGHPARQWCADVGKAIDLSLITNTTQIPEYRAQGMECDYFQIGIDTDLYKRVKPTPKTPEVVLLATEYATYPRRNALVAMLTKRYGKRFGVYGMGWATNPRRHPMLKQNQESGVYGAAKCAISMSVRNNLELYSSDRLFRAMASGAVVLAEEFPSYEVLMPEGTGFVWKTDEDLVALIDRALETDFEAIRAAAAAFAKENHSWTARMPDLLNLVEGVRARRATLAKASAL